MRIKTISVNRRLYKTPYTNFIKKTLMVTRQLIRTEKPSNFDLLQVISEYSLDFANFKMEEHAEPTHVGRGVGVDWVAKRTFETEAEMKAYCLRICYLEVAPIVTLVDASRT